MSLFEVKITRNDDDFPLSIAFNCDEGSEMSELLKRTMAWFNQHNEFVLRRSAELETEREARRKAMTESGQDYYGPKPKS